MGDRAYRTPDGGFALSLDSPFTDAEGRPLASSPDPQEAKIWAAIERKRAAMLAQAMVDHSSVEARLQRAREFLYEDGGR